MVLQEMATLTPYLYTALEIGTMKAREYFDAELRPINRYLAPEIVRYHAKTYLDLVANGPFSTEPLARNGLWVRNFRDLEIRILKSYDGELPLPGSKAKQEFYQQLTLAIFETTKPLKLVVLWDVSFPYNLQPLTLACPRTSEPEQMLVEAHWYAPIPYPVPSASFTQGEQGDENLDDIIKKPKKSDSGTDDDENK